MLERPPKPPTAPAKPRSSSPSAQWNRAYRRRKKLGLVVCKVEVDGWILDLLVEAQFLPAWDAGDRTAIARALQDALHVWSRYESP